MSDHLVTAPPLCPRRHLHLWCLRHIKDQRQDGTTQAGGSPAAKEIPGTNAEVIDYCVRIGLTLPDALCGAIKGTNCPHPVNAVYYNSWSRTLWVHGVAVREFHRDADNQAPVLEALQDAGWPPKLYSVFRAGTCCLSPNIGSVTQFAS